MLVSDFVRKPAFETFGAVPGVRVVMRHGRPWVHLDGGRVQVRFKVLNSSLGITPSRSQRAVRLAWHLEDLTLVEEPREATVLTAGYVLDPAGMVLQRLALVCLVGFTQVHYAFPLPGGAVESAPTQLPLAPLSAPIIRSARAAAAQRLAESGGGA